RELGRATMSAGFVRLYGAAPAQLAGLTPASAFADLPQVWPRLHSWGRLTVETSETAAQLILHDGPLEPLVCCLVEGSLERIAELCGGIGSRGRQVSCESHGDNACQFDVSWSVSGPLPS